MSKKIHFSKASLVLSGGGMKAAAFHIGVSLAMEQKGLSVQALNEQPAMFDSFIGASAGSVIATFFAAGYSPNDVVFAFTQGEHELVETLNINMKPQVELPSLRYRDIFALNFAASKSIFTLPKLSKDLFGGIQGVEGLFKQYFKLNGFFSTRKIGDYLKANIFPEGKAGFEKLDRDLFVVATHLDYPKKAVFSKHAQPKILTSHDHADYINDVDVPLAVMASAALPPVFSPVKIKGQAFFDGEVRDSLNSHIALDQKSDLVVVSYSMQPYKHNNEFGSLENYGLPVIVNQALYQLIQQKIINHIEGKSKFDRFFSEVEKILNSEIDKEKASKIMKKLEKDFYPDRKSKVLYIHPSAKDHEMFFADHLSLKPEVLNKIVTIGFKSAMDVLRTYEFFHKV